MRVWLTGHCGTSVFSCFMFTQVATQNESGYEGSQGGRGRLGRGHFPHSLWRQLLHVRYTPSTANQSTFTLKVKYSSPKLYLPDPSSYLNKCAFNKLPREYLNLLILVFCCPFALFPFFMVKSCTINKDQGPLEGATMHIKEIHQLIGQYGALNACVSLMSLSEEI